MNDKYTIKYETRFRQIPHYSDNSVPSNEPELMMSTVQTLSAEENWCTFQLEEADTVLRKVIMYASSSTDMALAHQFQRIV